MSASSLSCLIAKMKAKIPNAMASSTAIMARMKAQPKGHCPASAPQTVKAIPPDRPPRPTAKRITPINTSTPAEEIDTNLLKFGMIINSKPLFNRYK